MADTETLQARLEELEATEHAILTGQHVEAYTRENGDDMRFSRANLTAIRRQINTIKRQLGIRSGVRLTVGG